MEANLGSMFYKKIDRPIKGVIKVGQSDEENVKQELEEYVVTRELSTHIDKFLKLTRKVFLELLIKMVFGYQDSLEVVNLTS